MFSFLLTITATQAIGHTLSNGCPSDMPNRYPGNNRCFQHVWYGSMCNVDPYNDPLSWQQADDVCQYSDRRFYKKTLTNLDHVETFRKYLENTICPKSASQMVDCYRCETGEGDCTEFMIFKDEAQFQTYMNFHTWMTPAMWDTWVASQAGVGEMMPIVDDDALRFEMKDLECVRVTPSHGTELPNGCPSRVSNRYPGNNRCFENIWDGEMCNVNPQQDPLIWQQNDRQCAYDDEEVPDAGYFYSYSSLNDCSGTPNGVFQWSGKLDVCQDAQIHSASRGGSDLFPAGATKYFKLWCDADVLKAAVYSTQDCSGAPVRDASVIPRSESGNCHVRTNWKNGLIRSHVRLPTTPTNGDWYYENGGGFKFAPNDYPCPSSRRSLKQTANMVRRLLQNL